MKEDLANLLNQYLTAVEEYNKKNKDTEKDFNLDKIASVSLPGFAIWLESEDVVSSKAEK